MDEFFGTALALLVTGIAAALLARSIFPLLVVVTVIWVVGRFLGGFSGGSKD